MTKQQPELTRRQLAILDHFHRSIPGKARRAAFRDDVLRRLAATSTDVEVDDQAVTRACVDALTARKPTRRAA
jgi:hypothetical protein